MWLNSKTLRCSRKHCQILLNLDFKASSFRIHSCKKNQLRIELIVVNWQNISSRLHLTNSYKQQKCNEILFIFLNVWRNSKIDTIFRISTPKWIRNKIGFQWGNVQGGFYYYSFMWIENAYQMPLYKLI